jgi:hypothetical protein
MAYLNENNTIVEKNTEVSFHFKLPEELVGLDNWSVFLENKDTVEILPIPDSDISIKEYGEFIEKSVTDGIQLASQSTIKVLDSGGFAVGDTIRLGNFVAVIENIDNITHILTLSRSLPTEFPDVTSVRKVLFPHLLGRFWFKITPTKLGNFRITLVDNNGIVESVFDDIRVVNSLSTEVTTKKVSILGSLG